MAVRETIQIGHPALKAKNKTIKDFKSKSLKQLIEDLRDTLYKNELIGIAAPQIAENYRVFVTEPRETEARPKDQADEFRVYINPEIIYQSKAQVIIWEGCGSVLHGKLFGPVKRPRIIEVQAFNEKGAKFRFKADGILGRVIQHEYDHLNGIEFTEKVYDYKRLMSLEHYLEQIRNVPRWKKPQKITIKEYISL